MRAPASPPVQVAGPSPAMCLCCDSAFGFTRGFVISACLSAFQDAAPPCSPPQLKRVLRHALQGGTAFAAGSRAAMAVHRGDYTAALVSAATGAAGVLLIERMLGDRKRHHEEQRDDHA